MSVWCCTRHVGMVCGPSASTWRVCIHVASLRSEKGKQCWCEAVHVRSCHTWCVARQSTLTPPRVTHRDTHTTEWTHTTEHTHSHSHPPTHTHRLPLPRRRPPPPSQATQATALSEARQAAEASQPAGPARLEQGPALAQIEPDSYEWARHHAPPSWYLSRDGPESVGRRPAAAVAAAALPSDVQAYEAAVAAGLPAAVPADWRAGRAAGWPVAEPDDEDAFVRAAPGACAVATDACVRACVRACVCVSCVSLYVCSVRVVCKHVCVYCVCCVCCV
jgi:hypothetical protein